MTGTGRAAESTVGADAGGAPPSSGQARRRARTRAALLAAGRELVEQGREEASIAEITRRAGVGFGSFVNHFPEGKSEFFRTAALAILADLGLRIGEIAARHDDPAEAVAAGFRATLRTVRAEPGLRAVLLRPGTDVLVAADTLLAAAARDIRRGIERGRFVAADPQLLLVAIGSMLIGTLRLLAVHDEHPAESTPSEDALIEEATEAALRVLGVAAGRA